MDFDDPDFLSDLDFDERAVAADDNVIQTFQLEESRLRGRAVRLGGVLNEILGPHNYPEAVAHLVAETITLAALLSSMLKYEGIFTLQTKGDGPVSMLVADIISGDKTKSGEIRGCASFDPERLAHAEERLAALEPIESSQNHLAQYLGKGYIAFTVDPKTKDADRYQGIVELKGASLVDCVQHYFTQSEQIRTGIKMAVGRRGNLWRAGGVMLQHMPEAGKNPEASLGNIHEDDWRRSMILMDTCTEDELLDPGLHSNALLFRLFHEEGVRVYRPAAIKKGCRCDEKKVEGVFALMPADDLEYMAKNEKIQARCEFCSKDFTFDLKALKGKMAGDTQK